MAEALAAIGLAANIAQFIEYGLSLFSQGREIYTSTRGATEDYLEIETVVRDLRNLSDNITAAAYQDDSRQKQPSEDEKAIRALADSSKGVANRLLVSIQALKIQDDDDHRKLTSLRLAFRSMWKRKEVEELERRLQRIQEELRTRMLSALECVIPDLYTRSPC